MFNLLNYKKIYHNNLEIKEISTTRSKGVHNVYMFMYHYICKLRINLISQYFPVNTSISRRPGKYEYFPLFCQPCLNVSVICFATDIIKYQSVCILISSAKFIPQQGFRSLLWFWTSSCKILILYYGLICLGYPFHTQTCAKNIHHCIFCYILHLKSHSFKQLSWGQFLSDLIKLYQQKKKCMYFLL